MCGRYVLAKQVEAEQSLGVQHMHWRGERSFNVAPARDAPVVRNVSSDGGGREGVMMRWGLVPPFLKGEPPKYATHNARIETLETSPAFRDAWKKGQRCVVPAAGFYEWQMVPDAPRQPWFIGLATGGIMPFAGLWERSVKADRTVVESFSIVTLPANDLLAGIHAEKRMPAILHPEDVEVWLSGSMEQARATLIPYPADRMRAYPVSSRVSSVKNDDETLLEAVEAHAQAG
jgi:putative SOS response-associated peptidase YedK